MRQVTNQNSGLKNQLNLMRNRGATGDAVILKMTITACLCLFYSKYKCMKKYDTML
ncbi:hypothetical protein SAMN05192550_2627 [Flavobacterium glycines]|uniref:Uncharacterized protein n=1 Tax=Flavobacterium glycines TaxID=551990 RepID=A0A511CGE3_9FLAO|nr:hypothetical protein FGL01_23980 [Flavobacterium glycines]SDJ71290.1 hypothetical protein SAMN05192550_2627 [Flavobacterium glycines]